MKIFRLGRRITLSSTLCLAGIPCLGILCLAEGRLRFDKHFDNEYMSGYIDDLAHSEW